MRQLLPHEFVVGKMYPCSQFRYEGQLFGQYVVAPTERGVLVWQLRGRKALMWSIPDLNGGEPCYEFEGWKYGTEPNNALTKDRTRQAAAALASFLEGEGLL